MYTLGLGSGEGVVVGVGVDVDMGGGSVVLGGVDPIFPLVDVGVRYDELSDWLLTIGK